MSNLLPTSTHKPPKTPSHLSSRVLFKPVLNSKERQVIKVKSTSKNAGDIDKRISNIFKPNSRDQINWHLKDKHGNFFKPLKLPSGKQKT